MKNLEVYKGDCFAVYTKAVNGKSNAELRNRLHALDSVVQKAFESYKSCFDSNTLNDLIPDANCTFSKDDLLTLYSYKSKTVRELREEIRKIQPITIQNTCQHCAIDSIGSLDHVLPKDAFPEFVLNPLNLIPCCPICNSHKNNHWKSEEGAEYFINLYTDRLPRVQYLFVEIEGRGGDINFHFKLENKFGIEDITFKKIESHYRRLKLLQRLKNKSISVLTELDNSILVRLDNLPLSTIQKEIFQTAHRNMDGYGHNYYKSALEIALVSSDAYLDRFRK